MRKILAILALLASAAAYAQLVQNPLIVPSTSFVAGDCIQATGPNSVATTGSACGTGSGGAGNVTGPTSSTIDDVAAFSNAAGTGILDTGIAFSHIGILGNTQTWTGVNTFSGDASFTGSDPVTFSLRPTFGGNLAWDAGNFNPANYAALSGSTFSGLVTFNGDASFMGPDLVSFALRPTFNGFTPWDSGNFTPSNYAALAGANAFTGVNSFTQRPTFNGATPWDSGNFNPALYLPLTGGTVTGAVNYDGTGAHPYFNGPAGTYRGAYYETSGVNRWSIGPDVSPESGGNAGSNWTLAAYDDTGVLLSDPIIVHRATGVTTFSQRPYFNTYIPWDSGNLTNPAQQQNSNTFTQPNTFTAANAFTSATPNTFSVRPTFNGATPWDSANLTPSNYAPTANPTFSGALTVNGTWITVSAASGTFERYTTNTIGSASYPTWEWGTDGTAQTGSNAGSNFGLWRMSDTGVSLGEPISINRASGAMAFAIDPTAPTPATGTNGTALATTQYTQTALTGGVTAASFTTLATSGASTLTGPVNVSGNVSSSTLSVSGVATFGSNIVVTGTSTFNGNMSATSISSSGANYFGSVDVTGNTTLGTSNNSTTVNGSLNVTGGATIGGNTTIGTGTDVVTVNSYLNVSGPVTIHNYTVETLPTGSVGMRASVSDANICGFNSYVAGGGSLFCPVIYNGSGWVGG
jgi:hypothetical protein